MNGSSSSALVLTLSRLIGLSGTASGAAAPAGASDTGATTQTAKARFMRQNHSMQTGQWLLARQRTGCPFTLQGPCLLARAGAGGPPGRSGHSAAKLSADK